MFRFDIVGWIVGIGLAVLIYVLQELKVAPPLPALWALLVISTLAIGYGLLALVVRVLLLFPPRRRVMQLAVAVGIGAVLGGGLGAVGWLLAVRYQQQTAQRTSCAVYASRLRPILRDDLGIADKIEYDMRGDPQITQQHLEAYAKRVEDWRTLISKFLAAKLPNSGADSKFLHFRPVVGAGGARYEYERLNEMRGNLISIIDNLETYCQRSNEISEGVAGLVQLRAEGVAIRNRPIHTVAERMKLHEDFEAWDKAVVREMRSIGVRNADIGFFETLDLVPGATFPNTLDQAHAKDLRELTEKLRRLQEITQRHDQR